MRTARVLSSRSSSGSAYLLRLAVKTMTSNFWLTSVCTRKPVSHQPRHIVSPLGGGEGAPGIYPPMVS